MNINVEIKDINYTNKRDYIDLSNLNLTNELIEPLFEAFPNTEIIKKIDITGNEGIVDLIINTILDKGYLVIYDDGQCIVENESSEDESQNTENNSEENTENNNSDNEQNNESEENINGNDSNENNG